MNIIGGVIKQVINLKNGIEDGFSDDVAEVQKKQLVNLLKKAKDTAFGKYYGFKAILEADNIVEKFRAEVPIHDYDMIYNPWWKQQLKMPDITWPGMPDYFARSSGTTGSEPKRIPVTDDMIESIRSVGVAQITATANFDLPTEFFEKQMLMLGSSTRLIEVDGHEEGEISGISASNIPGWFEAVYKPGAEISSITDWDERIKRIAEEAPKWDIGAMSGIPSWLLLMLKEVVKVNKVDNIHELWPNLMVYTTGGVAYEPYKAAFEKLFGKEVIVMDTYLASEGFFAYNARPETKAMRLALNHGIYYEFVPFDKRGFDEEGNILENPVCHSIEEVEENTNYALIISSCAGAWRYMIGDTVRFENIEEHEIVISGRTKYFLNVVGSQLSEDKMNAVITYLSEELGIVMDEFTVAAVKDENEDYYHEWIIGIDKEGEADEKKVGKMLDKYLSENNKAYGLARTKALKGVKVHLVKADKFYEWHEKSRKKGGQIKTKKVMKEEDFLEFKDFMVQD